MPALQKKIQDEAYLGRLPLLKTEREYTTPTMLAAGFAYAVATWCFLIGGYVAQVTTAVPGMMALLCGSVLGVTLSALATALACNRYGLEQIDFTKTCFGQRGAMVVLVFYVINQIGWTGTILVMMGRSSAALLSALVHPIPGAMPIATGLGLLAACALVGQGVHTLNRFNAWMTPGLVIVCAALFVVIFKNTTWSALRGLPALQPSADPRLNIVLAFEYALGAGFSWWPGIGFLARNAKSQRVSLHPQILTLGFGMGAVSCAGLWAGLLFRSADPAAWMLQAGGPLAGCMVLFLIAVANISASAMMLFTAALALRHIRRLQAWRWRALVGVVALPCLAYVVWPSLYDRGGAFLAYNATMFAPVSGILAVDYFVLRGQRLNLSQVFDNHPQSHYWFWRGYNLAALACMALGQGLYVWLLDPVSLQARGPVRIITATAPATIVPALLYGLCVRLWLKPRHLGGYGASTAPLPLQQPNLGRGLS